MKARTPADDVEWLCLCWQGQVRPVALQTRDVLAQSRHQGRGGGGNVVHDVLSGLPPVLVPQRGDDLPMIFIGMRDVPGVLEQLIEE